MKNIVIAIVAALVAGVAHAEISHVYTPAGVTTINQIGGSTFITGPTGTAVCNTIGNMTICN